MNYEVSPVEIWKKHKTTKFTDPILLNDFRRNSLSGGTLNPPDRPSKSNEDFSVYQDCNIFEKIHNLFKLIYRLIKFETRSIIYHGKIFKLKKDSSDIRIRTVTFSKSLTDSNIRNSYYYSVVQKYFKSSKVILEIGSGYGHLAHLLFKNMNVKICLIDLPENLILANQYLSSVGIDTSINFNADNFNEVTLLLPCDIDSLLGKVDLVINTMSFQHMTQKNINDYFHFINLSLPKFLYLVNRNIKRDETDVVIDNFPISNKFKKIFDKNFQTNFHKEQIWISDNK